MRRRNPDAGLVVFWVKLTQRGYSRSIPGLYRFLRKQELMAVKPHEQMDYPGQRIQIDEWAKTNWTAYILGIAVILATVIFMFFLSWNSGEKQKAVNEEFAGRIKEMFY